MRRLAICAVVLMFCVAPAGAKKKGKPRPVVVRDAKGVLVGSVLRPSEFSADMALLVARTVNGVSVAFLVTADGFPQSGLGVSYESADCSGPARILEDQTVGSRALLPIADVEGPVAYYAQGPLAVVTLNSVERAVDVSSACGDMLTSRGTCCGSTFPVTDAFSAVAGSVALGALGLTPPFHVEGP